jgi:CzcA family heavy metal efflux pump
MMRRIVASSLKFRFLVVALAAGLMFAGVEQLGHSPVDVFPEFAPPKVEVQTPSLGLSPSEVESLVTVPLEEALNGVPGLDVIRSKSVPQLSSIEMIFKPGTDELHARQWVQERMAEVVSTLPNWAGPPVMIQPLSSTSRVMKIGLSSKNLNLMQQSMMAYWTIRSRLLRVPGVANVPIWGERLQLMQVQVDPDRLQANNVSLDKVMETTAGALDSNLLRFSSGASVVGTGGFVDTSNQRLNIQHVLPITTPEDLAQIVVEQREGKPLRLGDVADVLEGEQPLIGDAVINGGPGLMLIIEKLPWANTMDVTRGVEQALRDLKPGLGDMVVDSKIFRPADFIQTALHNLSKALVLGSLLMIIMLFFFLWEWRVALISVVAMPLSLVGAVLVLHWRGATINTMILAGLVIALGDVVDDAIIDIENVVRRLREHRKAGSDRSTAAVILGASLEVRGAIIHATLIEVVAVVPVFFIGGLSGAFFRPLIASYALAVMASLVVALTVTPALALILLRNAPLERRESPLVRWLHGGYERVLSRVIRSPRPALAVVALITVAGVAVIPHLGQELFPSFKENDFLMHWVTKPGTSLPEERRIVTAAAHELRTVPGVRNFGSHIGQALLSDEVGGSDFGENWISIDPKADYGKTVDAVQEVVDGYPGLYRNVETYLGERIEEVLTGSGEAIVVRIFGNDLEMLRNKAAEVTEALSGIPGIVDLNPELQTLVPHITVQVDLASAQKYGLKPGDVRRAAATLIAGEEVGDIYRGGKTYDVNVWSTPKTRNSLTSIQNLLLDTPGGGHVRMADVARVAIDPTPNIIKHEGQSRRIDVLANAHGRDLGSVVGDVKARLAKVQFPLGYHAEVLGEYKERQGAQKRLLWFGIAAAVAIFLLLQASFNSWRLATLTLFMTLPMALIGGLLGAYLTGGILTLGSLVGLFTVLGVVARHKIMLIEHYQHLERYEGETFGPALVLRGAKDRLSPILMTTLAAGLSLVPLILAGDRPGQEIEYPMAIVILGGLITSTLLNLFVVPSMYLRFGKSKKERLAAEAGPLQPAGA